MTDKLNDLKIGDKVERVNNQYFGIGDNNKEVWTAYIEKITLFNTCFGTAVNLPAAILNYKQREYFYMEGTAYGLSALRKVREKK